MPQPFHLAFFVKDLASTRRSYSDVIGCAAGRRAVSWGDFDTPTLHAGKVDGIAVPMPHCGAIVEWDFILEPRGMALEFRSFRHPEHVVTPA